MPQTIFTYVCQYRSRTGPSLTFLVADNVLSDLLSDHHHHTESSSLRVQARSAGSPISFVPLYIVLGVQAGSPISFVPFYIVLGVQAQSAGSPIVFVQF